MTNPFVHVELQTKDLPAAKSFYSQLFGWTLEDVPMPGGQDSYTMIRVGEGTGGGMFTMPDAPPMWLAYVGVDDIVASTARARELGANVIKDVTEVGDYGWMTIFIDPAGAMLAMWQPKPQSS